MAGKWQQIKLRDVCERITKGTTPTTVGYGFTDSGINFIKSECLTYEGSIDSARFAFISQETHEAMSRSQIKEKDILMSMAGVYLGKVALVAREHTPANTNQAVAIIRIKHGTMSHRFVAYCLRTPFIRSTILNSVAQSAQPNINLADIGNLVIPNPPLNEQRAIAHILGTLDDKIELNRRMNEMLEAMARALFKSWFVDFNPVRAKAEGRWKRGQSLPCLPAHLFDLFPDSFEDSEMGKIPKGWEVKPLPELNDVNPARSLRKGDIAPYLDMANMPTRGHAPDQVVERPFGSGMRFINGDTLVARITPCLENGKTAFVDFLQDGQVGWGSTEYIVIRTKPPLPEEFAYCLARSDEFREFAIQSMTGSSGRQRVQAESLCHFMLIVPPRDVAMVFGRFVSPLFVWASGAVRESRTLAALRDSLLPKLVSGELHIKRNMQKETTF